MDNLFDRIKYLNELINWQIEYLRSLHEEVVFFEQLYVRWFSDDEIKKKIEVCVEKISQEMREVERRKRSLGMEIKSEKEAREKIGKDSKQA